MRKWIFLLVFLFSPLIMISCFAKDGKSDIKQSGEIHEDPDGYYTCSMHHEVHQHEPGHCPICGMTLIKVPGKEASADKSTVKGFEFSQRQEGLAGIKKYKVERKDLTLRISFAGRLTSSREVSLLIYESDAGVLKSGMRFRGSLSADPGDELTGKIRAVDSVIDPSTRTLTAIGILDHSPKKNVIDGSFYGDVEAKLTNQIAVPDDAVFHAGDQDLVYVFSKEDRVFPREVVLGKKAGQEYQIISGLNEGEVVSSGANFLIDSETKIRGGNDKTHH